MTSRHCLPLVDAPRPPGVALRGAPGRSSAPPAARRVELLATALLALLLGPSAAAQLVFEPPARIGPAVPAPWTPVAGDYDGDGHEDVAFLMEGATLQQDLTVLLGDGSGGFTFMATGVSLSIFEAGELTRAADLNADGDLDVLFVALSGGTVGAALGNGDGTFVAAPSSTLGAGFTHATLAHVDGDAFPDVVAACGGVDPGTPATVAVALGDGDGTFTLLQSLASPFGLEDVSAGDLDGDGTVDVVAGYDDGTVRTWTGGAGPSFTAGPDGPTGPSGLFQVELADLDDDGALDLIARTGNLSVWLGNGDGTFDAPATQDVVGPARDFALADFDQDGHLDAGVLTLVLLPSFEYDTDFEVLRGLGDGTLETDVIVTGDLWLDGPAVLDADEDGFPDAAFARNMGPGEVVLARNHTYGPGSPWLDLGDALEGLTGYPVLLVEGSLVSGQPFEWNLANGRPSATAYLVFGLSQVDAGFKGGVLKPSPDLVIPVPTGPTGDVDVPGTWPTTPGGFDIFLQYWIPDAGGVFGFSSTTGVRGSVP